MRDCRAKSVSVMFKMMRCKKHLLLYEVIFGEKFTWKFFKKVADLVAVQKRTSSPIRRERNKVEVLDGKFCSLKLFFVLKLTHVTRLIKTAIHVFAYCSGWIKQSAITKDSVSTSSALWTTLLQSLPYHFFCSRHAGFAEWEQKLQITGLPW